MMLYISIFGLILVPVIFAIKNKKVRYTLLVILLSIVLFSLGYQMGSDRASVDKKELKK